MEYQSIKEDIVKVEEIIQGIKETLGMGGEFEYPEAIKALMEELIITWDKQDTRKRNALRRESERVGKEEFESKYNNADCAIIYKSPSDIHKDNEEGAKKIADGLIERITAITGPNPDYSSLTYDLNGLEGTVAGNGKMVAIKSAFVGGYNIQRLHVRFFVKEI